MLFIRLASGLVSGLASLSLILNCHTAWADKSDDHNLTTIHNIDLSKIPDGPTAPNYSLIVLDVKKVRVPGSRAHMIFRQFNNRVRLEFEASGIPYGKYRVGVIRACSPKERSWTILHEVEQSSTHLATEKSLPKYALRQGNQGQIVLQGMKAGLFQIKGKKSILIDCKSIL